MNALPLKLLLRRTRGRLRQPEPLRRKPRVSVVIPCYNYGRYLPQCVYSVSRNQPGIELEIIIVDDASTDDSADVALGLAAEDARITVIRHARNAGHIATYNDGLAAAKGEYVLLLSADDLATPGALTRAAALFEAEPSVGMVYGSAVHFSDSLPQPRLESGPWIVWDGLEWLRERCRVGYNVVASPEVMMRASTLREVGLYRSDLPHAGDFAMWMRAASVSDIGYLTGVDQAFYRKHQANMHRNQFLAATHRGQLIDLRQRWASFESVFDGPGRDLPERRELQRLARSTMIRQARDLTKYAYARGHRDFPFADFHQFILELGGTPVSAPAGLKEPATTRVLPLHPRLALWALAYRLSMLRLPGQHRLVGS